MGTTDVIVVGAGPTGLALAVELALAGVACTVLEKREQTPNITRAFGVSARTLELLDARGMAEDVLARGERISKVQPNVGVWLDLSVLPTRYNFVLIVPQSGTEQVLEERCRALSVNIVRGAQVTGLAQDERGVELRVRGPNGDRTERASYVVGCDGAHSRVRDELGVRFVGKRYDVTLLLADVRLSDPPAERLVGRASSAGIQLFIPFGDGFYRSISFRHGSVPTDQAPTLDEVRESSRLIVGTDYGMSEARFLTRFHSERKQAEHYRLGRVFLAGDAAHVHFPVGAQGMNTGIGDAMNLGWKLAAQLHGTAPEWLLDSYEAERHPVGGRVLRFTDRMFRLVMIKSSVVQRAARTAMRVAFQFEAVRRVSRTFLSGLDIAYPPRGRAPHKLVGTRAPELVVDGTRLAEALRPGQFVLVDPAGSVSPSDRLSVLTGSGGEATMMLVRPDGYIAWATDDRGPAAADAAARALGDWGLVHRGLSPAADHNAAASPERRKTA